jgi:hypothetical protein
VGGRVVASIVGALACALLAGPAAAHVAKLPPYIVGDRSGPPAAVIPAAAAGCPESADPAAFASTAQLLRDNRAMAGFGRRPTGSANQQRFIGWLEARLRAIDGVEVGAVPYTVDRWAEEGAALSAGGARVPISGAVPYAKPGAGSGPLVYVPNGTALSAQDVKGKVVVRDAVPGSVPNAAFRAVEWFEWDPDGTLLADAAGSYERDFAGYNQRLTDLDDAAKGGAAALVFVHGFPRAQVRGQYAPYEGIHWKVPAVYVGADEGERLEQLATKATAATVTIRAHDVRSPTRTIVATLPGVSDERMVVESHTDGMNAIWDNGPIAILALARHFAALPRACRPRTLQFVFTTGHLYQHLMGTADRGGGAEQEARQLDAEYDKGSIALVFALEHLGAKEYAAVPRTDGGPGRVLEPTGRGELNTLFAGESPVLVHALEDQVVRHDLRRTFVLRGSDAPAAKIPPHNSFGGEGTEYQQHLIPTIALVTGPWTLYNPAFGMEAIDGELMRRQTLIFADLMHGLASQPAAALGGGYLGERAARSLVCGSAFATLGLARCEGDPYG